MADGPGPLGVGHGDADELEADARAGGDVVGAGEQDLGQGTADVAAAEQADAHGRSLMGVRGGAGLVGSHLQTVQAAAPPTAHRAGWDVGPGQAPGRDDVAGRAHAESE